MLHYDIFVLQIFSLVTFAMLFAIWYHLYNSKNTKNTHKGVLRLIKLKASASNFTKSYIHPCVFFTIFKRYKNGTKLRQVSHLLSENKFRTFEKLNTEIQWELTCSKFTIETLEQGVKCVQS